MLTAACAAAALAAATPAMAKTVEVEMLNSGPNGEMMVFEPALVTIDPGDTVRFVATDKGHNAETVPGMLPDGAEPFKGKFNRDFEITFDAEGVYGYKCMPHYAMGMAGVVVVGDASVNLDAAKTVAAKAPGRAKTRFARMLGQVD
jgi:pseudoazurin